MTKTENTSLVRPCALTSSHYEMLGSASHALTNLKAFRADHLAPADARCINDTIITLEYFKVRLRDEPESQVPTSVDALLHKISDIVERGWSGTVADISIIDVARVYELLNTTITVYHQYPLKNMLGNKARPGLFSSLLTRG